MKEVKGKRKNNGNREWELKHKNITVKYLKNNFKMLRYLAEKYINPKTFNIKYESKKLLKKEKLENSRS